MKFAVDSEDEDDLWLLERIVKRLQEDHGHTQIAAVDALNAYLTRFADSEYCARYGMSAQTFQFWCRAESTEMADRVQYLVTCPMKRSLFNGSGASDVPKQPNQSFQPTPTARLNSARWAVRS